MAGEPSAHAGGPPLHQATTFEELKQYIDDTRARILEDPRTKQMIDSGQATWDEVKQYLKEHGTPKVVEPSGPTGAKTSYTYSAGYWYPLTIAGNFTAAPNSVFEVAAGDPEVTKKISLRPQVDVVFDAKASQLLFFFDLPGFVKDDVSVEIDKRCVVISGERPRVNLKERYGDAMKLLVEERNFGFFCRRFQLPPNAIDDTVSATMECGVLVVRISTRDAKLPDEKKRITID